MWTLIQYLTPNAIKPEGNKPQLNICFHFGFRINNECFMNWRMKEMIAKLTECLRTALVLLVVSISFGLILQLLNQNWFYLLICSIFCMVLIIYLLSLSLEFWSAHRKIIKHTNNQCVTKYRIWWRLRWCHS